MQQSSTLVSWYALKAYYNKIELIMEVIKSHCKETYVPMETVRQRGKDGKMIETERPLIPGVVFFRCDGSEVSVIRELLTDKAFIYHRQGRDKREPAPISDRELDNFRRFVDYSDHYERIDNQTDNLSKGQQVHVTEGPYKGFEGTVCRVKGNRHLVIAVTGVCAVMLIDYVPQAFLQKME